MTGKDVRRLEEIRREVGLMQADYGDGDSYDRYQAVLEGLDEAIDGPRWWVAVATESGGLSEIVVRGHSREQARARAVQAGFVALDAARLVA